MVRVPKTSKEGGVLRRGIRTGSCVNTLAALSSLMPTPPNYSKASPGSDRFCGICIYYNNGHCSSYNTSVEPDFTCWACVRNYTISAKQASSMLSGYAGEPKIHGPNGPKQA